jgi:hypothetical protein
MQIIIGKDWNGVTLGSQWLFASPFDLSLRQYWICPAENA